MLVAMLGSGRFPEMRDLLYEQELVPGGEQLMRIDVQVRRSGGAGGVRRARPPVRASERIRRGGRAKRLRPTAVAGT